MRHRALGMIFLFATLLAGPAAADQPQPGPNAPPSKYIVRQLGDPLSEDERPMISGTTVAWVRDGEEIMLYNPTQDNSLTYTVGNPSTVGFFDVQDQSVMFSENYKLYTSSGTTKQPLPSVQGAADVFPVADGPNRAWMRAYDLDSENPSIGLEGSDIGGAVSIEPAGLSQMFFPVEISGNYFVYTKQTTSAQELWGYHFPSQTKTLLTDPNYTWTLHPSLTIDVDLDGSQVAWSASYGDNGPLYADYEVYTYDLALGPSSYRQVTQNDIDDNAPRIAGDRLAWMAETAGLPAIMLEQAGNVESVGEGYLIGLSDTTIAWSEFFINEGVHAEVLGTHHIVKQGGGYFNWMHKGVSGKNLTFQGIEAFPGSDPYDVWVAYFVGPGAVLTGVDLTYEELAELKVTYADMRLVDLTGADLTRTDLRGSDLTGAIGLAYTSGQAIYSHRTLLPADFDPVAAQWSYVTPEPSGLALCLLGLLALGFSRPRRTANASAAVIAQS